MIDKNELIKLLPKLIREDDEIKGAIITALSGVVATKEDTAKIIENSNRRFEAMDKRFVEMDKRFETLITQMNKGFEEARLHRESLDASQLVIRKSIGEVLQNYTTKDDIEKANKEILDYLKEQFEKK